MSVSARFDPAAGAALLQSALATPARALARADVLLQRDPDDWAVSYAQQAAGIVLRDGGDTRGALLRLRSGLRAAMRTGDVGRVADVRATLGATLVMAGRTTQGLAELDRASATERGVALARIRLRRGHALALLGRYEESLADLRLAMTAARGGADTLWQARILLNRSLVHLRVGQLAKADQDAGDAATLFDRLGQSFESAVAGHNRGVVAARAGDIPRALRLFEVARARYVELGVLEPDLVIDTGHALLAAGLTTEAVDAAAGALRDERRQPVHLAELVLFAAVAAVADRRHDLARQWADRATRMFEAQRRPSWAARARLISCAVRFETGRSGTRLLARAVAVADVLDATRAAEAPEAHLLAGKVARRLGNDVQAQNQLTLAALHRRRGAPLARATGWLAAALLAGDDRALLRACGRGLDALDEHVDVFGAAEFRATATAHGRELAGLAVDAAVRRGSPREILGWSERWRATAMTAVTAPPDAATDRLLDQRRTTQAPGHDPAPVREQPSVNRLHHTANDADVTHLRLQLAGSGRTVRSRIDPGLLLDALGTGRMVVLVPAQGTLHAVVAGGGRFTKHAVGSMEDATREVELARFELQRLARSGRVRSPATHDRWRGMLERALLGPAVGRLQDDGPVVIVPPASLHPAPWGLLPVLARRAVSVAPSATAWLRATSAVAPTNGRVSLVLGPGLQAGAAEIAQLAGVHPNASVLGADAGAPPSAVDDVLAGLEDVHLAHIAAHGTFRADSPLFSSLALDDGPLFVHDLERVRRLPHRVVLSACDTGVAAPVGADELLGLVSSLLRLGSVGVLASVVPVNDDASAPFMVAVHQALVAGRPLAEAALAGRTAAGDDPLAVATAGSFSVWGV
ncbi:MAG: CHAT domain-containing tetratricopeptide repeat protein [Actinomycetota bacterium]